MVDNQIHRVAIIDSEKKMVCGIITHDMIVSYIIANLDGDYKLFLTPIHQFNIGLFFIIQYFNFLTQFQRHEWETNKNVGRRNLVSCAQTNEGKTCELNSNDKKRK
jgi:hypothetical protein